MKNIVNFLLALIIFSLCACSYTPSASDVSGIDVPESAVLGIDVPESDVSGIDVTESAVLGIDVTESAVPGRAVQAGEPLDRQAAGTSEVPLPIGYPSVAALLKGISSGITSDKLQEIEELEHDKGAFKRFIQGLRRDGSMYIPYYEENILVLRKEDGFSAISVFPTELYGKQWIGYFPNKEETGIFCVFMMMLDEGIVAEANKNGAPWLMKQMNPNGTQEGVDPYPLYDSIAEKEIVLTNGSAKALVGQFADDPRSYIHFVCGNAFVKIIAMPGSAGDKWISGLSFEKIPLDAAIEDTAPPPHSDAVEMVFTLDSRIYTVNGEQRTMDVAPVSLEGRTRLPIRYVAEPLRANVDWDDAQKKVTVTLDGTVIELWIDNPTASVGGVLKPIDPDNPNVAPIIVSGRTMLPIRFVAEALGCEVEWDDATRQVTINYS